jgi:hypothetical protein
MLWIIVWRLERIVSRLAVMPHAFASKKLTKFCKKGEDCIWQKFDWKLWHFDKQNSEINKSCLTFSNNFKTVISWAKVFPWFEL